MDGVKIKGGVNYEARRFRSLIGDSEAVGVKVKLFVEIGFEVSSVILI